MRNHVSDIHRHILNDIVEKEHIPCVVNIDKRNVTGCMPTTPGATDLTNLGTGFGKYPRGGFSSLEFLVELGFQSLYPSLVALARQGI